MKTLDLHGYKVHDAWKKFNKFVESNYRDYAKQISVITGHGKISTEIGAWVNANPYAVNIMQDAPNTGSFTIQLKKNTATPKSKVDNKSTRLATLDELSSLAAKWNN